MLRSKLRPGAKKNQRELRSCLKDAAKRKPGWKKRKRNVYWWDEKAEHSAGTSTILSPRGRFLLIWSKGLVGALTLEVILWPMRIAWPVPWWCDLATDAVFLMQICVSFRSAFEKPNGLLEKRPRAIATNYMRLDGMFDSTREGSLWLDLAALLPMHITNALGMQRWVVLLSSFPRLYRIFLLSRHFRRAEVDIKMLNVRQIALFKYVIMLLGGPHWWACFWWAVAERHRDDNPLGHSSWLHQYV